MTALSASTLRDGDSLGVEAARAVRPTPAASPRPGSPESEDIDTPSFAGRRLVTTSAGGQAARADTALWNLRTLPAFYVWKANQEREQAERRRRGT